MIKRMYRKISQRENVVYALLYDVAKWVRRGIHIPPIGIIYGPVSFLHYWLLLVFRTLKKIFVDEPVFRYRCMKVGKNLLLSFKVPLTSPNLHMYFGDNCSINGYSTFGAAAINETPTLIVGNNTTLAYLVTISVGERVEIGDDCLIADRVFIADNHGHPLDPERRRQRKKVFPEEIKPVKIGNNVWIGYQSAILRGVTIGDNSIVGANSVVTKDIPPNTIVAGNPARIVRTLNDATT
jgi:acetyltransferase-like isoleucine patch superfamily enzyme